MIHVIRPWLSLALALAVIAPLPAQTREGVDILLSRARSLEARGRTDLAAQSWNQVLLADPNQTEALKGLARFAKQNGDAEALSGYLGRLRKINPTDPAIAAIETMHVLTPQEIRRLDEAGRLAAQRKPDEAMRIYRQVFGNTPPTGKWAEAFYETEAASTGGRDKAIAQLRELSSRDATNEVYRLWLARVLTYGPKTRIEGLRLLQSIREPGVVDQARTVWRQALGWENNNPIAQASLEEYLKRYPDPELQVSLNTLREKEQRAIRDANEQQGFHALRDKDLETAQAKFEQVLRHSPNDANAMVGLGFVRLNQKRFDQAVAMFEKARALAPQRADVKEGYETARFWRAVERGAALQQTDPDTAIAAYREALQLRPQAGEPLLGIAQILLRRGNLAEARAKFEQVATHSPTNVEAIAGLGFVRLNEKEFDAAAALLGRAHTLAPDRPEIEEGYRSAKFWGLIQQAAASLDHNQTGAAIASYQEALAINPGAKEALAGLAEATRRQGNRAEAVKAYNRLATADPADARGWHGLIKAQLDANDPEAMLETVRRVPQGTRPQLDARPEFTARVALAFYSTDQLAAGDQALRNALDQADRADNEEALNVRLEIASLLLKQGRNDGAVSIYTQAVDSHPDNSVAWEGLIGAYAQVRDFAKAIAAVRSMPRSSYEAAVNRSGFLNAVATVYAAEGRCGEAGGLLTRSIELEKAAGRRPAESTQVQLADIFMREGRYDRAAAGYRDVLASNENSTNAWRGYITALHNQRQLQTLVAEAERMPTTASTALRSEPGFLMLLGSAQAAVGHSDQAVELLQEVRARHRALGQVSPIDLVVQLAWTMMAGRDHQQEVPALVAEVRGRADLTDEERQALDEISSTWSVRAADEAILAHEPAGAVAILTDASRQLPKDGRIHSALAVAHLKQHEYDRALAVYESWGMVGAKASDYRAAAGAALAAHKNAVADQFLSDGRQRWPNDAELLHMTGRRAVSRGEYDSAERYLKEALAAVRRLEANGGEGPSDGGQLNARQPVTQPGPVNVAEVAGEPACRAESSGNQVSDGVASGNQATALVREPKPAEPREEPQIDAQRIQDEIDVVANRNTPFVGIAFPVTSRVGDPGLNRLIVQSDVASGSATLGNAVRLGVEALILNLYSGTPDGRSGFRFGSLPMGARFAEQTASGYGGEAQLSTEEFGIAVGLTPDNFLVQNWTGGLRLGGSSGPVMFIAARETVKDSLLSYAGARDPGTRIVWGGVVSNSATVQFGRDVSGDGQYLSAGASLIRGEKVVDNWSMQGTAGAYWRVASSGRGGLSIGLSATGMHYDKNLNFFSLGHGGYFSPQRYILGSVPISWLGRQNRVEFEIRASGGVQYLKEDGSALYPTNSGLQPLFYLPNTQRGPNYNLSFRLDYRMAPHWYLGAFATANNARNYASQTFGVTLKLLTSPVPTGTDLRPKQIPDWRGIQPFNF
jgi:tetratricopeptide (TPR) repeat protein